MRQHYFSGPPALARLRSVCHHRFGGPRRRQFHIDSCNAMCLTTGPPLGRPRYAPFRCDNFDPLKVEVTTADLGLKARCAKPFIHWIGLASLSDDFGRFCNTAIPINQPLADKSSSRHFESLESTGFPPEAPLNANCRLHPLRCPTAQRGESHRISFTQHGPGSSSSLVGNKNV